MVSNGRCTVPFMLAGAVDHHDRWGIQDAMFPLSLFACGDISGSRHRREDCQMSRAVIGRRVGHHPATITREVTSRGCRDGYRPEVAHAGPAARWPDPQMSVGRGEHVA